jgi:hypothetical protein
MSPDDDCPAVRERNHRRLSMLRSSAHQSAHREVSSENKTSRKRSPSRCFSLATQQKKRRSCRHRFPRAPAPQPRTQVGPLWPRNIGNIAMYM